MLSIQALAVVCIVFWGVSSTFLLLWLVNKVTPLRMTAEDELLGADFAEHGIASSTLRAMEAIGNSSANGRSTESQISPRNQSQSDNKTPGIYKAFFAEELGKPAARENPAYTPDESV